MKRFAFSRKASIVLLTCLMMAVISHTGMAEDRYSRGTVIPPTTYITGDQAHARLFRYNGTTFTNISAANQNISPEVNAIAWNGSYWAMAARGRFWTYNGTAVTEVLTPDPVTPADNIYPYAAIGSKGAGGGWLAGTLTGRGMYYNGTTVSEYLLTMPHSHLTANVDGLPTPTLIFPVNDGTIYKVGDVVEVDTEYCLVTLVAGNNLTVTRNYNLDPWGPVPHSTGTEVSLVGFSDGVSVDWDVTHTRWIVGGFTPMGDCRLFTNSVSGSATSLGLPGGVNNLKGDYRVSDYSYYLVGGQTKGASTSKLYAMDISDVFTSDLSTTVIANIDQGVTAITGGASTWLVGGQGTGILYSISVAGTTFTGTAITTPTELTSVTAIGYGGGTNWLVAGTDSAEKARLYSYNGGTFTDLTSKMQTETQAAITTINTIVWNGTYWLIGGAGEYNVGPDNGGSVMSIDEAAKVAFSGGAVDGDSSVRVGDILDSLAVDGQAPSGWKALSSSYDYRCVDLLSNAVVTQFDKSVTISIAYDPAQLGSIPVMRLSIYYYNTASGTWVLVPSVVDPVNHVITASVNHFSDFQIFDDPNRQMPNTGI